MKDLNILHIITLMNIYGLSTYEIYQLQCITTNAFMIMTLNYIKRIKYYLLRLRDEKI